MYIEKRLTSLEHRVAALEGRATRSSAPGPAVTWNVRRQQLIDKARRVGWPNREFPREDRIMLLVEANPKRGTARLRFALYRDGMSVGDYLDAVAATYPGFGHLARGDLSWDMGQGWIDIASA